MICKKCGQKLKDNAEFCPNCGLKIENTNISNDQKKSNKKKYTFS